MRKVRLGVIGTGSMGQGHIRLMRANSNLQLAAVADADAETARQVGEANRVPWFSDYRRLLRSGLCEAVLIATPHYQHPVIGITAFEAGLHVLCEKPITVTVAEADRFLAAARKSGRVFAVMHQNRLKPEIKLARKLVEGGALGTIRRTLMVDSWYRSQAYYDSGGWRGTWAGEGGGVLLNQSPHQIDIFMLLAGLPRTVTAKTRTARHDIEVEDQACALLEYENGAWGYFHASTSEMPTGPYMEIVGDRGKLVWHQKSLRFFEIRPSIDLHIADRQAMWGAPKATEKKLRLPQAKRLGHPEITRNFCNAILHGTPLVSPGEEGIRSVEFINAMILSGHKQKPVNIPVDRAEYDQLLARLKKHSRVKPGPTRRETDPRHAAAKP